MKTILLTTALFFSLHSNAHTIDCFSSIEGEDVGGKFVSKVHFNSFLPSFSDSLTITPPGEASKEYSNTYLSPNSVCGLQINFAESCTWKERLSSQFGYSFTFTCGDDITRGEIYCDENCMKAPGSLISFTCEGPKVDKIFSKGSIVYQGCMFTKEN